MLVFAVDARHSTADQPALGEKYRLIRQLEVGGMGSVWLARHVALDSLVAVKLISREVAATPAGLGALTLAEIAPAGGAIARGARRCARAREG